MRKAALLVLFVPALVAAQAVSVASWPNGSQGLNEGWRMHSGDNLSWAQPSFDDSAWPAISLSSPNDSAGWNWYRLDLQMPAPHTPLALLLTGGGGTYEVYVNGEKLAGPELSSSLAVTYPKSQVVPLPSVSGPMEIALRTHIPATSMFLADRGTLRVELGTLPAVDRAHRAELGDRIDEVVVDLGIHSLLLLAGLSSLLLFWYQRDHREYFWLGVYLLLAGSGTIVYEVVMTGFTPFAVNWLYAVPIVYFTMIAQIEFTFSFVGQRVTRPWRVYEWILLIPPFFLVVPAWFDVLSRGLFNLDEIILIVPAAVGLPALLLLWYRRGYREAGWLIFPSLLPMLSIALSDFRYVDAWLGIHFLSTLENPLRLGTLSAEPFDLADLLFLLAIGIVIFFRFTRVSREQARTAAELEAAREIQQRLVPLSLPTLRDWRIHAAYLPAQEVGGDFYQVLEQPGGSTLIVIGDVSGKGLKAAMTGALALGSLRTLASEDLTPAALLARLNRQIFTAQDSGFITCLCVRIVGGEALAFANAGHLAPYWNGEEFECDSGLPLGIDPGAAYTESTLQLAPGDQLTFLSDGVVEAQSATGELFGFDRTCAISIQSAEEIARAAQQFGQEDDITVLTLQYAPAEVLHA